MAKKIVKKKRTTTSSSAAQHIQDTSIANTQLSRLMKGEMRPNNQKMLEMERSDLIAELYCQYQRIEYYHYYIIFLLEMVSAKIMLTNVDFQYNIIEETFRLNALRKNIARVSDPNITLVELDAVTYAICDTFIKTMGLVCREISKTERYNKVIRSVIVARSRYLQNKPDGTRFTPQECYSEVIRVSAITYLCKNITRLGFPVAPFPETLTMPDGEF